ncbi:MAG: ABC transporter permease subunit [Planctomycetaceae bacterium]|jgi:ABC-type transport system involved in multi-copper enzyme maturation permease subunit|nr:ABC transporter permease subunit [Planctomycetaceae bacterium]
MYPVFAFTLPTWIEGLKFVELGAVGVFIVFGLMVFSVRALLSKVGAIAWVTAKEAIYQPLFTVLLLVGCVTLLLFPFIPYYTLGDDIKLVITQGITLIKLLSIFLAVWIASNSIADEIEGKTALMALSKPIGRPTFIFGKYLGVMIVVTLLFLVLALVFTNTISYKLVYDARESSKESPTAVECFRQVVNMLPGLVLTFFETCILAAIAVAISTRLSLLPNLSISLTIYILGHLVPIIVQSSIGQFAMIAFVADLSSAVLPNLESFSMETAVMTDKTIQWQYVGLGAIYTVVFCFFAFVVSLLLFEDRDLA